MNSKNIGHAMEPIDAVVIGAGQAGLATSYELTRRGVEHVVLERGKVGETWRSERWDGFYLNTPNWSLQLPGFHYDGPNPDAFASLRETVGYFEAYAESFCAPVREQTGVTGVRRTSNGLQVETPAGAIEARSVIVAAGAYQRPTPNRLAQALPSGVMSLHTTEYRRPSQLPEGAVAIIGSGQSGCQIAEELRAAGRDVYLSVGRCPWVPRRYRGRDVMYWNIQTGLADQTVDTLPSPAARFACNPPVSGNDGGHDCNPRTLAASGVRLLGRLEVVEGSTLRCRGDVAENLAAGDAFVAAFRKIADEATQAKQLEVDGPEAEDRALPVEGGCELDLRKAGVQAVIWANGFRPDHSWIEGIQRDEQGWPVQRRGVTSIPGLYFVGLHWLYKRKSPLLIGVGEDAAYVAEEVSHFV